MVVVGEDDAFLWPEDVVVYRISRLREQSAPLLFSQEYQTYMIDDTILILRFIMVPGHIDTI